MYIHTYICIYIYMCVYMCIYIYMYIRTYMYIYLYICVHIYIGVYIYVCICIYIYVYINMCIYIYIYHSYKLKKHMERALGLHMISASPLRLRGVRTRRQPYATKAKWSVSFHTWQWSGVAMWCPRLIPSGYLT